MLNDYAELLAVSAEKMADRKGLDWLIDYAISAMEGQHRQRMSQMHALVQKIGDAVKRGDYAVAEEIYDEYLDD